MQTRTTACVVAIAALGFGFGLVPLLRGELFFVADNAIQNFPETDFLVQALRHGHIPQWWPNAGAGFPVVSDGQIANYDPVHLILAAVLDAPAAFMTEIGVCFALSGLGTYLYLRRIRLHPFAAVAGSLGFMFGSQDLMYVRSMGLLRAGCLLPWVIWVAERLFRERRSSKPFWWGPPLVALQFLSGNPTFAVITALGVTGYLACRIAFSALGQYIKVRKSRGAGLTVLFAFCSIVSLGVTLASIQVVPTLQHQSKSVREGGLSLENSAVGASRFSHFIEPLFPYAFVGDDGGFYAGAFLAVAALFVFTGGTRLNSPASSLALSGLLAGLIAVGNATPLFALLHRLPMLSGLRFPFRYQFWVSFCFACLGAMGVHRAIIWNRRTARDRWRGWHRPAVLIAVIVLLAGALLWRSRPSRSSQLVPSLFLLCASIVILYAICMVPRRFQRALLLSANLFLLADLFWFRLRANYATTKPISEALRSDGLAGWLRKDPDHFRILPLRVEQRGQGKLQNTLYGAAPTVWGLDGLELITSLRLRTFTEIVENVSSSLITNRDQPDTTMRLARFLGFLQTKYVIAPRNVAFAGWSLAKEEGGMAAWRNPQFLEGDYLVGRVEPDFGSDDNSTVKEINSRFLDFHQTAVISDATLPMLNGLGRRAEVRRLPHDYDAMDFRIVSDTPALLVIASNYYPGWVATVNGRPSRIFRTDWIGMGVLVGPGESAVAMRFRTPGLSAGMGASGISLTLWIAGSVWYMRLRRSRTVPELNVPLRFDADNSGGDRFVPIDHE